MTVPLFVPLVLVAAPADMTAPEAPDPPIQVWFDNEGVFDQGDRVRVFARALRDGYMLIVHADVEGRVRVLFPLDPVQDDFVRGGQTLEILGRGDEGAFSIVQPEGYGTVLAAWSPDPFHREGLIRGDHWDYRVIAPDGVGADPEAALLDIVHAMAPDQPFEYHTATYIVGRPVERAPSYAVSVRSRVCLGCYSSYWHDRPVFGISFSIGTPYWSVWYRSSPWYDPYYRPIHFYDPWRYTYWRPVYRPIYWYDPWYDPWWSRRWVHYRPGVSIGIRYAGCWNCGPGWHRPYRPGRATGVSFGDAYWRNAGVGVGAGTGIAYGGVSSGAPGQGIARGTGQERYAVPRGGSPGAGRGTGTAQPSSGRITVLRGTPPSRARNLSDNPVRGVTSEDRRIGQQAQQSGSPIVTGAPQRVDSRRPDRNAVVRSGTQATPPSSGRSAVSRGIGQSNSNTRVVPDARASRGIGTRPSERSATVRSQILQRGSSGATVTPPPSRSGVGSRAGVPTRSSNTRAVPSRGGSSSRVVPSTSGIGTRVVPGRGSSGSSRAIPSRTRAPVIVSPPARSSGGSAARAGAASRSGASSRAAPTRSSASSRSGGVASRASSSRSSASGRASGSRGSASRRSGGG